MSFNFLKKRIRLPQKQTMFGCVVFCASLLLVPLVTHAQGITDLLSDPGLYLATGISFLGQLLITTCALILQLAGILLREVILFSVINIHGLIENEGVYTAWSTFRDLANMLFIFILLYAAINTILGLADRDIKQLISRVVIIALLLNFSFFFTKIAVDASNIVAIGFYNQIAQTKCKDSSNPAGDIGEAFVCKLNLASIYNTEGPIIITQSTGGGQLESAGKFFVFSILASIFILITAFVLFASFIMFVVRLVTLIFLFILSPLAFISNVIPGYSNQWDKWLSSLVSNCIFAPAFFAMMWAVFKMFETLNISTGSTSFVAAIIGSSDGTPAAGAGTLFLNFSILIAMMVGVLIVAKETGAYGAGGALKMLDNSRKWAQGKIGRGAVRAVGIRKLDEKIGDTTWGKSRFGRAFRDMTTGFVVDQKFGSKSSVADVDKKLKKGDEKYAESIQKKTKEAAEKKFLAEVNDVGLQTNRLNTTERVLANMANQEKEAKKYWDLADIASTTGATNKANEYIKKAKAAEAITNKNKTEKARLEKLRAEQQAAVERAKTGNAATKEEKEAAVKKAAEDKADKLASEGDYKPRGFIGKLKTVDSKATAAVISTGRGAVVGAAIGSAIPVVGTAAGAITGAGIGALATFWGAGKAEFTPNSRKLVVDVLRGKKKIHKEVTREVLENELGIHLHDDHHEDDHGDDHGGGKKGDHGGGGGKKDDHGGGHGGGGGKKDDHGGGHH